jgi:hypothetical protein
MNAYKQFVQYQSQLNNPDVHLNTAKSIIAMRNGEKMHPHEFARLKDFITNLDPANFANYRLVDIPHVIAQQWVRRFPKTFTGTKPKDTDIKEQLRNYQLESIGTSSEDNLGDTSSATFTRPLEQATTLAIQQDPNNVTINKFLGVSSFARVAGALNPTAGIGWQRILLDTRSRSLENDGTEFFSWTLKPGVTNAQGIVSIKEDIRDVVFVKFPTHFIPVSSSANYLYRTVSCVLDELDSQSTATRESTRFHAMFEYSITDEFLRLDPTYFGNGEYKFNPPITRFNKITLRYFSPVEPIYFDKDRLTGTITTGTPTLITFTENHNTDSGDVIYISDFSVTTSTTDATIINTINQVAGHAITSVPIVTQVTIGVDTSTLIGSPSTAICTLPNGTKTDVSFRAGSTTTVIFPNRFNLSIGDTIYISGFTTTASLYSSTISTINRSTGHISTRSSDTAITIDIDTTSLVGTLNTPTIYFGSKRLLLPIEISYIKPQADS